MAKRRSRIELTMSDDESQMIKAVSKDLNMDSNKYILKLVRADLKRRKVKLKRPQLNLFKPVGQLKLCL